MCKKMCQNNDICSHNPPAARERILKASRGQQPAELVALIPISRNYWPEISLAFGNFPKPTSSLAVGGFTKKPIDLKSSRRFFNIFFSVLSN